MFRRIRSGGILGANSTSRMESSANGVTFFGMKVSFIFGVLFIVLWLSTIEVRPSLPSLPSRTSRPRRRRLAS